MNLACILTNRTRRRPKAARFSLILGVGLMVSLPGVHRSAWGQTDPRKPTPRLDKKPLTIPGRIPALKRAKAAQPKPERILPSKRRPPPPPTRRPPPSPSKSSPDLSFAAKAGGDTCKPKTRGRFEFKMVDKDVKELVESISALTCKNFIITNKVRSQKFTITSPTKVTLNEVWRAFLSTLEAHDLTIVRIGKYHKIIPATEGTRSPVPIYDATGAAPVDDAMITVIWKLKHGGDVNTVVNYLNIFKSGKGQIHPFAGTGTIVATDFGTSIGRLERILSEIDQPGALEQVHVVGVEFASASEIADKLTQIFEPAKGGAAAARKPVNRSRVKVKPSKPPKAPSGEDGDDGVLAVSKIIADERTNKLIIIASDKGFQQITALMRELDVPDTGIGDGQIHVVRLKHADAEEMASTLSNLSQGRPGGNTRNTRGKAAKKPSGSSAALFQGEVKVTADKATNSLVVTASKSDLASLKRVVERLDIPRFQVFVEAVIMEVSVKRDTTVGVGWHGGIAPTINGEQSPILFGNTPNAELSSIANSLSPINLVSLLGLAGAVRGPPVPNTENIVPGGIPAIGVVLQALQSTNDVNVVSTPHLLTMDNEEAEIQVNEKRPFPSGLTLGGLGGLAGGLGGQAGQAGGALGNLGGLGLGAVSFNREDVGLTLKLKPQINDADYVRLEIDQELSDVAGIDQVTNQVITSKRSAKTTVVVRSQDSVVIGGLVRDRETLDESKTPLLGDLPLIGWLFKRRQKVSEKVNLILVITPYIIRGPDDFRLIFERKMEERREFVRQFYGTTDEYRAAIDWRRRKGPLASYQLKMKKEMMKLENEGPGTADETVIRPDEGDTAPGDQTDPETPPVDSTATE